MLFLMIFLCAIFVLQPGEPSLNYPLETYQSNSIFCPHDKMCAFVEQCPVISNLMAQNLLPIHRFRQAICGYENIKPKVCCDVDSNSVSPTFTEENSIFFSKPNSTPECGSSLIRSNVDTVGTYPFVVRIGFINVLGEIKYSCSGVILNERLVLTTASCALARSENYKLHSVLVGEFNAETNPDCNSLFCGHETRNYNISYVLKHPNYRADTFSNNVALLRLEEPLTFSVTAQPVCIIPRNGYINVSGVSTLVGWGKLSVDKVKSTKQRSLNMKIISNQECSRYYQGLSVELCALGNEIPCSGYSGSPLLYKHGDTYFLSGILSYGSNCNSGTNFPSVFVDIQRHTRWILENC